MVAENSERVIGNKIFERMRLVAAFVVTIISLALYWSTVAPSASYWDCPEYIVAAYRLESGHPPGNPVWMLASKVATLFSPSSEYISLACNMLSGIFSALTVGLLSLTIMIMARRMFSPSRNSDGIAIGKGVAIIGSGVVGSLVFAVSDSFWFSAVESEVYAFSSFCTALVFWMMLHRSEIEDCSKADRWFILTAYITGLSIGVHQLNLLAIPALTFIYAFSGGSSRRSGPLYTTLSILSGFAIIAVILFGLMPGMVSMAELVELAAVNLCHLPYNSGLIIYVTVLTIVAVSAIASVSINRSRCAIILLTTILIFLSGVFALGGNIVLGIAGSVVSGLVLILRRNRLQQRRMTLLLWSFAMIMLGYSCYGVMIIRGTASTPMNQGGVTDIFTFASYIDREQYGSHPLFYGATSYATPLRKEVITRNASGEITGVNYSQPYREDQGAIYRRIDTGGEIIDRNRLLTHADSLTNMAAVRDGHGYVVTGHKYRFRYAPELSSILPRIFSGDADDLDAYRSWAGMEKKTMTEVEASTAIDSTGKAVGKLDLATGKRQKDTSWRPTLMQTAQYTCAYQIYYMYIRYLLWNFSGRQNDRASQGALDNGNFITGFNAIDSLMLSNEGNIPTELGEKNAGHHRYFLLPLLLGIIGIVCQSRCGRNGKRDATALMMLFLLTGLAIVVYLNQTPGEPRERDYSFVGSFYAYAAWIGIGIIALAQWIGRKRRVVTTASALISSILGIALAAWMGIENYHDHDRSGVTAPRDFASNILQSLDKDAILLTDGDNNVFPLWYAREVEGVRTDVRVISSIHMNVDWYPGQLMMQDYDSKPLPFTATAADMKYGAFKTVLLSDAADYVDAISALKKLYSSRSITPTLPDKLRLAPADAHGDSIRLDLRKLFPQRNYLLQSELLTTDLIATNAENGWERSIYWTTPVSDSKLPGLKALSVDEGLVMRFAPSSDKVGKRDTRPLCELLSSGKFKNGGIATKGVYIDPVTGRQVNRIRKVMIDNAEALYERGDKKGCARMLNYMLDYFPAEAYPFVINTSGYMPVRPGVRAGELLIECGKAESNGLDCQRGVRLLHTEAVRAGEYARYYNHLDRHAKSVLSPETSLESKSAYAALESYIKYVGSKLPADIAKSWKGVNLKEEKRRYDNVMNMRALIMSARSVGASISTGNYTEADSLFATRLKQYYVGGGLRDNLKSYHEFDNFDFESFETKFHNIFNP